MKKATGVSYILLALGAALGLMLEVVLGYGIEPVLYGSQIKEWSEMQFIIHWIIICVIWGVICFLLVRSAKKRYGFDLFAKGEKVKAWQWILIAALIVLSLAVSYRDWNGSKVLAEFQRLGIVRFAFQYLYYFFEMGLVTLILVFGQKACEKWFKRADIPYGGIVIALTWGIGHFFTQDFLTGILCAISGLAYGSIYLLVNRDIYKTYMILWIMFVL